MVSMRKYRGAPGMATHSRSRGQGQPDALGQSLSEGQRHIDFNKSKIGVSPLIAAELCTGRSESANTRCKAPNGQRPRCADSHRGLLEMKY